jgi:L-alanine-DL-glutamate epimerase-like enolase superfamily enzyme
MKRLVLDSDIKVLKLAPFFKSDKFRVPLKFGKVVVNESTSMVVKAIVENRKGDVTEGVGAMPVMDQWAFPDSAVPHENKLEAMMTIGEEACRFLEKSSPEKYAHPIDIMLGAKKEIFRIAEEVDKEVGLKVNMPVLGVLVATSPIDAALHDAFGRVNGICSYDGYGPKFMEHDLGFYLGEEFQGKYISDYLRPSYVKELPVFHLVGALDKLTRDEVDASDPRDGLPVSLEEWIERDGVFCLKVKLSGTDTDWDAKRTKSVAEIAQEALRKRGKEEFYLTSDANEMNLNPDTTLEYLRKLRKTSPLAFSHLLYLEQPTERELGYHRFSMKKVAKIKPVLADEGVTDFETFSLALSLGWSGVAIKACKWHSASLIHIAGMEHKRIPYSMQDLTCPGLALVHSASLASRTKPVKGFEYNARQYLPFAYQEVQNRHRSLFRVKDGIVRTDSLEPVGLGFSVKGLAL